MNKDLFEILKELRGIQPAPDYSEKSRLLIIASKRPAKAAGFLFGFHFNALTSLASAVVLILIILSGAYGVNYFDKRNQGRLIVRAGEANANIQIRLDEIKYLLEEKPGSVNISNAAEIQKLLAEAEKELKEALAAIGSADENSGNLEEFLNNLKLAEENIAKINSLIQIKSGL